MVVIPAPADRRDSPVIHDFAISNHEVILAEYRRFRTGWGAGRDDFPTDQFPIHGASWYEVAEYCNWLSKQEGLPESQWVYQPNTSGQFGDGVTIKENLAGLTGYRLPTDAEWEFACRAETSGTHGFGEPLTLLKLYCWHGANAEGNRHAVESLLPNDFGLFDLHGNLFEWVQNPVSGPMSPVKASIERANRGGTYIGTRQGYSSNSRGGFLPSSRFSLQGFRVARTLPLSPSTSPPVATDSWKGWPKDTPPPAIAPFDAEQAKQHQEVWAKHLGVPVEHTNSIGMKFRLIPPGEFIMGSTPVEIEDAIAAIKAADPNDKYWQQFPKSEAPQRKVILTQPIYLGVHEVTQAQYAGVMGQNPSFFAPTGKGKDAVVEKDTTQHPVEVVNWSDAAEFCARLSQQEKLKPFYFRSGDAVTKIDGTGYLLPTEAEWEFACRAGTTTKHWIGANDDDLPQAGWFKANADNRTHTVGELKANSFGLYDIHGNAWEWVEDRWSATYYGEFTRQPAINPTGPASIGSLRVIRGGSWLTPASSCRASDRHAFGPTFRGFDIGFRVALSVDAVKSTLK